MGAPKKADWREERRKQAWKLSQQGWKQNDIAKALGVSKGAVSQWMKKAREGGEEALLAHLGRISDPSQQRDQSLSLSGRIWNNCLAMHLILIPTRAFGSTSSALRWAISVVAIWTTSLRSLFERENVSDISVTSFRRVLVNVAMPFSCLSRVQ